MEKNCPECGEHIIGRVDKKFCSDQCRASHNNKLNVNFFKNGGNLTLNILVVCAHPDDETIGMGGTLKKLSKKHKVSVLFVAEGITARRKSGYVTIPQYDVSHEEMATQGNEYETAIN